MASHAVKEVQFSKYELRDDIIQHCLIYRQPLPNEIHQGWLL